MTETYYTVLGVPRTASNEEIKAAWLRLIRETHPDAVPNASPYWKTQAEERTKEINEAHQVLSDPEKRRKYDQLIDAYQQSQSQQSQGAHNGNPWQQTYRASTSGQQTQAPPTTANCPANPAQHCGCVWWHSPRCPNKSHFRKVVWAIWCLMWGGLWSSGLYSRTSKTGDIVLAFVMASVSFELAAWAARKFIAGFLSSLGITQFRKQFYWVSGTICLLLCTILAIGAVTNRASASRSRTAPQTPSQSGVSSNPETKSLELQSASSQVSDDSAEQVQVSQGISQGLPVYKVQPSYPELARQAQVQGTVELQALIGKDGTVQELTVISGHPLLIQAAMDAVKQWRYKPYLHNEVPVEVQTTVHVNFTLSSPAPDSGSSNPSKALQGGGVATSDQGKFDTQEAVVPGAEEMAKANNASDSAAEAAWLLKAAARGNPDALVRLADMYVKGEGVSRSCEQAVVLLKTAAEKENARARNRLASMYATGICVQRNRVEAYRWLSSALVANPNSQWAQQNKDLIWQQMTPEERTAAQQYR